MPVKKLITKRDSERMDRAFRRAAEGAAILRQESETGKLTFREMTRKEYKAIRSYYAVRSFGILLLGLLLSSGISFIVHGNNASFSTPVFLIGAFATICLSLISFIRMREGRTNPNIPIRPDISIEQLIRMDPYAFERFVAGVYQKKGYRVEVTPHSNDGGVDVKAWRDGQYKIIQCKRYTGRVGVEDVRALKGTKEILHADSATMVTAGDYTDGAKTTARSGGIELINGKDLLRIIQEIGVPIVK